MHGWLPFGPSRSKLSMESLRKPGKPLFGLAIAMWLHVSISFPIESKPSAPIFTAT